MKLKAYLLGFLLALAFSFGSQAQENAPYWKTIQNFKKQDSLNAPPKKAILFVGSSTFTKWTDMQKDFPKHVLLNRGFGGSQLPDVKLYLQEVNYPEKLKQIVIYAGDNDIAAGNSPEVVLQRFKEVFELIREELPKVPVAFVSIKSCPGRASKIPKVEEANALIKAYLKEKKHTDYIDTNTPTLADDGQPMPDIYVKDGVHLNDKGYEIWARAIEPHLK